MTGYRDEPSVRFTKSLSDSGTTVSRTELDVSQPLTVPRNNGLSPLRQHSTSHKPHTSRAGSGFLPNPALTPQLLGPGSSTSFDYETETRTRTSRNLSREACDGGETYGGSHWNDRGCPATNFRSPKKRELSMEYTTPHNSSSPEPRYPETGASSPSDRDDAFLKTKGKHTCPTCFKAFSRPSSLRIHFNSHTGETRKLVAIYCDSSI